MTPRALIALLLAWTAAPAGCGPSTPERLAEVRALHAEGRAGETIGALHEILEGSPDDAEALYLLGVALLANRQPTPALFPLARAAGSPELAARAGPTLCRALQHTMNHEAALRVADAAVAAGADPTELASCRLEALEGLRDWEAALAEADRVLDEVPNDLQASVTRAASLASLERRPEAIASWKRVEELANSAGRLELAARACVESSGFERSEAEPPASDAAVLARLEACVERHPGQPIVYATLRDLHESAGRVEEGAEALRSAVADDPASLPARVELAAYLARIDRPDDAERALLEATRDLPGPAPWEALAEHRRTTGDLTGAVSALRSAREQAGDNALIAFKLADLLVDVGELDEARVLGESLPSPAQRSLIRARLSFERREYRRALDELEQGLLQWPDNWGARALAGRAAAELGDFDRALAEYREAMRLDPGRVETALLASQLAVAEGRNDEAFLFATQHLAHGDSTVEMLGIAIRAARAAGRERWAQAVRARLREEHGAAALAIEDAREANRAGDPERAAEIVASAGLALHEPANAAALFELIEALIAAGQAERALGVATGARRAAPERSCLRAVEGRVQLELGRLAAAEQSFQAAGEGDASCALASEGLAAIAVRAGRLEQALELLEQALRAQPTHVAAAYRAAQVALALERFEEAERRLREVLRLEPGHAGAANDLAWLLAERGRDLDNALALAERSLRLAPSSRVYDTLGTVRLRRGELDQAIELLRAGVEAHPDEPQLRYRLGVALASARQSASAVDALEAALSMGHFGDAEQARTLLASLRDVGRTSDP
jgi:tetratricopeptide (TPR) repeat protein